MQPVGMDVHIFNRLRLMEPRENGPDPIHHVRRELPGIIFFEKPFQLSVLKTRDHALTVSRSASLVNRNLHTQNIKSCPAVKQSKQRGREPFPDYPAPRSFSVHSPRRHHNDPAEIALSLPHIQESPLLNPLKIPS